ncbi:ATP-binding protein [Candidatus Omnitrophota bacterium]
MQKRDFFDRKTYLEVLEKRVKAIKEGYRQNIAIIGDKDMGKTSIVLHFLNHFSDPLILPLYLELRAEFSARQFARKFIGTLLYNFLENSNIKRSDDIDFLISKAESFIPKTTEAIKVILASRKGRQRENIFIQLLSLCDILHAETGKFCVIIFDEFHHLGTMGIRQVYQHFSKMLMIQKNVLYIILSSAKFKAKKVLSSNLALLFGNFETIELAPFDLRTTQDFIESKLTHAVISKSLVDFLIHFTGGCPLYLKIISDILLQADEPVSKEKLAEIIQDLMFVESGILNQRFNNYLKSLFANSKLVPEYQELLHLIADGHNRLKDIAACLRRSKTLIVSRLNLLLEYDVVAKSGDFFFICDRVFGFWLRFVYHKKLNSLTFDTEKQKKNFRIKIEGMIEQFVSANRKSVGERTLELLRLFEDELIQIRTKKIRLTHFREVKTLKFLHSRLDVGLLGRSKHSLWVMAVKSDILTEDDIIDFARQCHRLRYAKPQRKVIITNSSIDTNVRLKAMEERVLTWNLDDLNQILDLYNKPRIIK